MTATLPPCATLVTDELEEMIADGELQTSRLYSCGPTPMLKAVQRLATEHGLDAQLALEAHMACRFGICLGCVVASSSESEPFRLVCKDGPVFAADEVAL